MAERLDASNRIRGSESVLVDDLLRERFESPFACHAVLVVSGAPPAQAHVTLPSAVRTCGRQDSPGVAVLRTATARYARYPNRTTHLRSRVSAMKTAILPAVMLSLLLGACTNFVGVDEVSLDFSSRLVGPPELPTSGFVARGEAGRIEVQGAIGTPVPCYDVRGEATRSGREVRLEVSATAQPVMCTQVVAAFGYEATLGRLDPGTYRLRVVHTHRNGGSTRTETLSEQEVRVR